MLSFPSLHLVRYLSLRLTPCLLGVAAFADETNYPVYEISDVPAQRIWYDGGNTQLKFGLVASTLGASPAITMSISESQMPDGPIAFDEETDTFSFTPAATDESVFTIAFLAIGDGTPIVAEVDIEPIQQLPAEVEAFGLEPGAPLPNDEENDKYFSYSETVATPAGEPSGDTPVWFNEADRPETRAVTISGRTIILEKDHPNGLFEKIHYDPVTSPNQNIERLEIFADHLIIRDSLHFPQTDVTLHALTLTFEDGEGETTTLSTTPLLPAAGVRPPAAGETGFMSEADAGNRGGNITLYLKSFVADGTETRFFLGGGKGRAASPGKDGTDKSNNDAITVYSERGYNGLLAYKLTFSGDAGVAPDQYGPSSRTKTSFDFYNAWGSTMPNSHKGGDASSPGRPGRGGDGGDFRGNLDLQGYIDNSPGAAGDMAADADGGRGTRFKLGNNYQETAYVWSGNQKLKFSITQGWIPDGSATSNSGYPRTLRTRYGDDAPAPAANGSGTAGSVTIEAESEPLWVSPEALRYGLIVLRDAYLDGHITFVFDELKRYLAALEEAEASPGWDQLEAERIDALEEIRDEMVTLKARLDNNLDFFGNPAGWVPMLSFEVNYAAFEQEIDRALRVMYLNYWLGNIADSIEKRVDGMKKMREQLLDQIDQDREAYSNAVEEIPGVRVQAEELQYEIDRVINEIKAVEKEVLKKAKRIAAAKKAARTLGKIAQMIPVYQPALGAAGGAVAAAADIDPNKSWEENAIDVGTGAATGFAAGNALPKGQAAQSAMGGIDTSDGDLADDPEVRAALKASRGPLLELAQDVGGLMLSDKAADPDVKAEMQRLLADHPQYRSLKKDLDKLNETKRDFASQISELLQKITILPIQVARSLRIISQLNSEIGAESDKLDPTTLSFLDDMNARAEERLLKYHYFMSRAYAYRRLESYPGTLNMQDIFDEIVELAGNNQNQAEISSEQFNDLKAVYESQISAVAEAILNEANENPSEQSISVLFELPQSAIDQINAGEVARINLADLDLFPESEENLRITGLEVTEMDLTRDPDTPAANAYSLVFKHSGLSRLQKDGHTYLFRHYSERTRSAITWKSVYQFLSEMIEQTSPSAASQSLIGVLVDKDPNDILIYTRPAVNADLLVSSEINTTGAKVTLNSAKVRLRYDFTAKSEFIKSLKISPAANGLMPEIKILDPDRNQRADGRDAFERFYDRNTEVSFEAPAEKDGLTFLRWEGATLADPTSPTQTLTLSNSYQLTPVYEITETYELTVEGGAGSGTYELGAEVPIEAATPNGFQFLRWNGESVESASSANTNVIIYGDTTVSAVFESSTQATLSSEATGDPGQLRIRIESDDHDVWSLQTSPDLETWTEFQEFPLVDGSIESTVDIGTDAVFFKVVPVFPNN